EMQEALERREAGELFVIRMHLDLGLAESLRVVEEQVNRTEKPEKRVQAEETKRADQQGGHEQEDFVQQRIVHLVERIGMRLVSGEPAADAVMALLAGSEDVLFGQTRAGVAYREHVVVSVAVVAGGDVGGHVRPPEGHRLAMVGLPVMGEPVLVAAAAALVAEGLKVRA